jgi:hypothetical protein
MFKKVSIGKVYKGITLGVTRGLEVPPFGAIWLKNKGDTSRQPIDGRTDGNFFYPKNIKVPKSTPEQNMAFRVRKQKSFKKFFWKKIHFYFFKILPPYCFFGIKREFRFISKGILNPLRKIPICLKKLAFANFFFAEGSKVP